MNFAETALSILTWGANATGLATLGKGVRDYWKIGRSDSTKVTEPLGGWKFAEIREGVKRRMGTMEIISKRTNPKKIGWRRLFSKNI
jgi:hypothetical protein